MYPHSDASVTTPTTRWNGRRVGGPAMSGPVIVGIRSVGVLILSMLLLAIAAVACGDPEPAVSPPTTVPPVTVKDETAVPTPTAAPPVTAKDATAEPTPTAAPPVTAKDATAVSTPTTAPEVTAKDATAEPTPTTAPEVTAKDATAVPTPTTAPATLQGEAADRAALVALYNATGGANWRLNDNWLSDAPISEWLGVITYGSGRVTELNLPHNQLAGPLPPELGNLTGLIKLDLSGNQLTGEIPRELGGLNNLTRLSLSNNMLTKCIPEGLLDVLFNDLYVLGLPACGVVSGDPATDRAALVALYNATGGESWNKNDNWLSEAPIGEWYGVATDSTGRVINLVLHNNQLTGGIPAELGNLTSMAGLFLSGNQLSGEIPPELGNPTSMIWLVLSGNQLSGEIPPELGNLTNLQGLSLSGNQLSGEVPFELGNLTNLQQLVLSGNQLSGEIPPELGNLTNLQQLVLSGNQLSGCIPAGLQDVPTDDSAELGMSFCETSPQPDSGDMTVDRAALVALYNATDGASWVYRFNWLSEAPIGEWYGVTADEGGHVTGLDLSVNRLSGEMPTQLSDLNGLKWLILNHNQLTGEIPSSLGGLTNLTWLELGRNQLRGEIPQELGDLTNLRELFLAFNQLSGEIPPELGSLANLLSLGLQGNRLSGEIPPELSGLAGLTSLSLSDNQLSGEIPSWLGNLSKLRHLGLSDNQLTGEIPTELGDLSKLRALWLSDNQLTGEIPAELESLTNLQRLDLTQNQLTGCIPEGLQDVLSRDSSELGLPFCGQADQAKTAIATPVAVRVARVAVPVVEVLAADRAPLVALYNATNGANWRLNINWLTEAPIGEWHGVTTDPDGRVTGVDLNNNQLTGPIPPELSNLASLQELQLSKNQLTGEIPPELGDLSSLRLLDLGANRLTGPIPSELGNLAELQWLRLSGNQLTGCIPTGSKEVKLIDPASSDLSICGQTVVVRVAVPVSSSDSSNDRDALVALYNATGGANWMNSDNWLSDGSIGEWYGVTTDASGRVTELILQGNELTGPIPPELGNLTNLLVLGLTKNRLSGAIPPELGDLSNLRALVIISNRLTGAIPVELGSLSNLQSLALQNNQLTGTIPSELGDPPNLGTLFLSGNELSGCIPAGLRGVTSNDFDKLGLPFCGEPVGGDMVAGPKISISPMTVSLDQELTISASGFRQYEEVALNLDFGGDLSTNVTYMRSNKDGGWGLVLISLEALDFVASNMDHILEHGVITVKAQRGDGSVVSALLHVVGEEAPVSGDSSSDRAALVALYNATDGANWKNNDNWLSEAPIGKWFGVDTDASGRVLDLNLEDKQLSGTIPPELGNLTNLRTLSAWGNEFTGPIPPELGNLASLIILDLSGNRLSGAIPPELGSLANLQLLAVRHNQLTGTIPPELGNLASGSTCLY